MTPALQIHTIVSMPFAENSYFAWLPGQQDCVVIDPGLEPDLLLDFLSQEGRQVAAILNTHGHADHIAGNAALKQAFPEAPLIIGQGDVPLLTDPYLNVSAAFGMAVMSPQADRIVHEGDVIEAAGLRLEVLEIPGHSPGHVVFVVRTEPVTVFGGDVLFRGGIGRSDFPGGDQDQLLRGIHVKLYTLPEDTVVYPGHGPVTTVGHEKRTNPFVRQ